MSCNTDWFKFLCEENDDNKVYLNDDRYHDIKGYDDISVMLSMYMYDYLII